jgi:hypothetical protein
MSCLNTQNWGYVAHLRGVVVVMIECFEGEGEVVMVYQAQAS